MSTTTTTTLVEKIAEAVLYEGYILYPYRASSRKNRERFTFGRVYPEPYSVAQNGAEPFVMQTECIVDRVGQGAALRGSVRFLHPMAREIWKASESGQPLEILPELRIDGQIYAPWHEAVERNIAIPEIPLDTKGGRVIEFYFPDSQTDEVLHDSKGPVASIAGVIRRRQHVLVGEIEVDVTPIEPGAANLRVRVLNRTPMPASETQDSGAVLLSTLASTHTILCVQGGAQFVSQTDPPADRALAAGKCENIGTWPVLVGEGGQERDVMLSSPIILYDYPQIAPESTGSFCDGLEIDELLSLRVMTMTDAEKTEMRGVDEYARRILERTESLGHEELLKMHGRMSEAPEGFGHGYGGPGGDFFDEKTRLDSVCVKGVWLHPGDRVRIRPKNRADAIDMLLAGKTGEIEAIEQDAEDRVHLGLVIEDDPGRDLGMMRQPGHRFFYTVDEVEPI